MSETGDNSPVTIEALGTVPLFAGLSRDHLAALSDICLEEEHQQGDRIFAGGDPGDKLYLILDGAVRISHVMEGVGEEALAVLETGSYFGEMALIDEAPRSADAVVHRSTRMLTIRREDFEQLLFVNRELAYAVLWSFCRTLSRRLRESNEKIKGFLAMSRWV